MKLIALPSLLMIAGAAAQAQPVAGLDFKGVPFGAPLAAVAEKLREGRTPAELERIQCTARACTAFSGAVTFGGDRVPTLEARTTADGGLGEVRVSIHASTFDTIVAGLTEKYGPPTSGVQRSTTRNAMNAEFPQATASWRLADGSTVDVVMRVTIERGQVLMRSAQQQREIAARDAAKPAASRDL